MLKIIDLLLEEGRTTVSALSERLKLSTRQVRYDIECINSLHEKKQPLIETDNKGLLYAKDEEDLRALRKNAETLSYSQPQRLLYMRLIIAFDLEAYNLSRIAEELSVSRMTARNDMQLLEQELKENGLSIRYQHGYSLSGSVQSFFAYRCKVIYQLKYLLFKEKLDSMETQLKDHFFRHFFPVRLADVVPVLMSFLHSQNVWLDDAEFHHIYTKVLVILWYSYNLILVRCSSNWKKSALRSGMRHVIICLIPFSVSCNITKPRNSGMEMTRSSVCISCSIHWKRMGMNAFPGMCSC